MSPKTDFQYIIFLTYIPAEYFIPIKEQFSFFPANFANSVKEEGV